MYRSNPFCSTKTPGLNMWKHLWTRKRENPKTRKREESTCGRENGENAKTAKTRKPRKRWKRENGENPKTRKRRKRPKVFLFSGFQFLVFWFSRFSRFSGFLVFWFSRSAGRTLLARSRFFMCLDVSGVYVGRRSGFPIGIRSLFFGGVSCYPLAFEKNPMGRPRGELRYNLIGDSLSPGFRKRFRKHIP